jgi:Domain of unknown function (DUF4124)
MPTAMLRCLCLLVLAACAPLAHAQVYRCIGAHGEPVFSGEPCATPASSGTNAASPGNGFGATCAVSPGALKQELANAFATHDVNRLAGLILWRDMDQASARTALRALTAWLKQPLTGIAMGYATGPPFVEAGPSPAASAGDPASGSSVATQPPTGFDISTGGVDGSTRDFGVTETGGCWWLTF